MKLCFLENSKFSKFPLPLRLKFCTCTCLSVGGVLRLPKDWHLSPKKIQTRLIVHRGKTPSEWNPLEVTLGWLFLQLKKKYNKIVTSDSCRAEIALLEYQWDYQNFYIFITSSMVKELSITKRIGPGIASYSSPTHLLEVFPGKEYLCQPSLG